VRRVALPLLLVPALLALSGCGATNNSNDYKGAQKDVAQAIDDLGSNARKVDASAICDDLLTTQLKAKLAALAKRSGRGSDCADQLKDSLRDADAFDMDVKRIGIASGGKSANVVVKVKTSADKDPVGTLQLVDERGWRLSQLP
jgi:hypothetical protein